jgi:hypothetical protein
VNPFGAHVHDVLAAQARCSSGGRPWVEERRAAIVWAKGIGTAFGDGGDL